MRIKLGELRRIIRTVLAEAGGGTTLPPQPMVSNPMAPSMADREEIGRNSIKDMDEPDEVAPHLREPVYDEEDCWGPVPPTGESPYVGQDMYTRDFNVIPTSTIKR